VLFPSPLRIFRILRSLHEVDGAVAPDFFAGLWTIHERAELKSKVWDQDRAACGIDRELPGGDGI
jgi:hypothetical protein